MHWNLALFSKLNGVVNQVYDDLECAPTVAIDHSEEALVFILFENGSSQSNLFSFCVCLIHSKSLLYELNQVEVLACNLKCVIFQLCEIQQVLQKNHGHLWLSLNVDEFFFELSEECEGALWDLLKKLSLKYQVLDQRCEVLTRHDFWEVYTLTLDLTLLPAFLWFIWIWAWNHSRLLNLFIRLFIRWLRFTFRGIDIFFWFIYETISISTIRTFFELDFFDLTQVLLLYDYCAWFLIILVCYLKEAQRHLCIPLDFTRLVESDFFFLTELEKISLAELPFEHLIALVDFLGKIVGVDRVLGPFLVDAQTVRLILFFFAGLFLRALILIFILFDGLWFRHRLILALHGSLIDVVIRKRTRRRVRLRLVFILVYLGHLRR